MRTVIFGDSYADVRVDPERSWPSHLTGKVRNFALAGTDLQYSYRLFTEHHRKYDRVIVLVTAWSRLWPLRPFTDLQCSARQQLQREMISGIQLARPDALILPCFDQGTSLCTASFNLYQISDIDHRHYKVDPTQCRDLRCCHINDENNVILAQLICDWQQGRDTMFSVGQFVHSQQPRDYYFDQSM